MVWDSGSSRIGIQGHEFGVLGPGFGVRDSWSGAARDSVSGIRSQGVKELRSRVQDSGSGIYDSNIAAILLI